MAASSPAPCRASSTRRSNSRASSTSARAAAGDLPGLTKAVVDFDRDGRLSAGGLPSCPPARIAAASSAEARELCRGAIVGEGKVEALIFLASGPVPASSPLTIFNGPRGSDGEATVVLHAQTTVPGTQTYAIVVPIEQHRGYFRYRATLEIPPIAAGLGVITRIKIKIGRRFKSGGRPRSYVSAHCSDGILQTSGRFSFDDGERRDRRRRGKVLPGEIAPAVAPKPPEPRRLPILPGPGPLAQLVRAGAS